jgi:hypothetical protein
MGFSPPLHSLGHEHVPSSLESMAVQPVLITPVAGVWWNPNEASGRANGLDFKDGVLIVQIFSYLDSGPAQWLPRCWPGVGQRV